MTGVSWTAYQVMDLLRAHHLPNPIIYQILRYSPCFEIAPSDLSSSMLSPNVRLLRRLLQYVEEAQSYVLRTPSGVAYAMDMLSVEKTILRLTDAPGWYIMARRVEDGFGDVYLCIHQDMRQVAERALGLFFSSYLLSELG